MLVGLGLDVCRIDRIQHVLDRHGVRFSARILAEAEQAELGRLPTAAHARFLAKRFAAKEAFSKALGTGIGRGFGFTDVWVTHGALGEPRLDVSPRLAPVLSARGVSTLWISLTDEIELAAAVCVLESQ